MKTLVPPLNKLLKKIGMAVALLIILAAICSSIFRALTPWAKQYKAEVEQHLSTLIGQPVHIGSMETGWYWFQPVLKLKQVSIQEPNGQALRVSRLLVGINLFKSLWQWDIQPGVLYVDNIHLVLREKNNIWHVEGLTSNTIDEGQITPQSTQKMLVWLTEQERLVIKHLSAHIHFQDGGLLPLTGFNLTIINHGGHYTLKGSALLQQTNMTSFQLVGNLYFNPYHFDRTQGQIYFLAKQLQLAQWQSFLPRVSEHLEGGKGDIALWVDLDKGAITSVQTQVQLEDLAWYLVDKTKSQLIQELSANVLWKPTPLGWTLQADKINLRAGEFQWPQNQLAIEHDKEQQSYKVFVKSILIESLLSEAIPWPKMIQKLKMLNPHGVLNDTQVLIKENQLMYLLTRFYNLSWEAQKNLPKVSNLSGALHWQPEEGRLELDSEQTDIVIKGYPVQRFSVLNLALDWKALSDGLRVSLERLALSLPTLSVSAEGALSGASEETLGTITLNADLVVKNIESWISYIPKGTLKPQLQSWFKNNLKHIDTTAGKFKVQGKASEFPFDNPLDGEFSFNGVARGGEILIGPKWPPLKALEGSIVLNKRDLNIQLTHGDMGGVPLNQVNLRIDDIGHDKENLLIHGLVQAPAQKGVEIIKKSPLNHALSILNNATLDGILSLDLQLEIPLYPENDNMLVEGKLDFNQNNMVLKNSLGQIRFEDISGRIPFNEQGVAASQLTTTVFGNPWSMQLETVQKAKEPYTHLLLSGDCNVESLQKGLNLPHSSFFKGHFFVNSELTLPKNPKSLAHLNLSSTLKGLKVNLPVPLGKSFDEKKPLELTIEIPSNNAFRVKANYNSLISTDLLFRADENAYALYSGQIKLGSALAVGQEEPGVSIAGQLDAFPFNEWRAFLTSVFEGESQFDFLSHLKIIDLTLGKLTFLNQQWNNLSIKAKILPNQHWAFDLKQSNIVGDFNYHQKTNALSGHIKRLNLKPLAKSATQNTSPASTSPEQIPNLNLRIDELTVEDKKIGAVTLKSQSSKGLWALKYGLIESPFYRFNFNGQWTQQEGKNKTKLEIKGQVSDLAKSLERWQITPAVSAKTGTLEFVGGWNKSLFDFSWGSLNGTAQLQFKNGNITHLSKETEEKLGLGKLLSILSLQTLPRRLQLDFSDLSHEGYSFDVFKGTFVIKQGIMSTQDSYLDGPVAYAAMKGELDLAKRNYALDLQISPHITASLPIVATIAGGPIAGVATWVASKIINQGMQKISSYSYKITGPWNQPVVQQLNIVKQKPN